MGVDFENDFSLEKFIEVVPKKYAESLKIKFQSNPELWYKVITPKEKAEELCSETGNDYSQIWHAHCECCFKTINKNSKELCFVSEDEFTWLCEGCYNLYFKN